MIKIYLLPNIHFSSQQHACCCSSSFRDSDSQGRNGESDVSRGEKVSFLAKDNRNSIHMIACCVVTARRQVQSSSAAAQHNTRILELLMVTSPLSQLRAACAAIALSQSHGILPFVQNTPLSKLRENAFVYFVF